MYNIGKKPKVLIQFVYLELKAQNNPPLHKILLLCAFKSELNVSDPNGVFKVK